MFFFIFVIFLKVENFFSTVSTAIDSQSVKKASNDSVAAAANILDVTEDIGRTMASTLGKCLVVLYTVVVKIMIN